MRNYSFVRPGLCTISHHSGSGTFIEYTTRTSERASLSNTSVNGNPKDFHNQTIAKYQVKYLEGKMHYGYSSGPNYDDYDGQSGFTSDPYGQSLGYSAIAYNRALGKLYDRLRGELDLSIDLLEARQARSMMERGLRDLYRMTETVRRMRRSPFRTASNLWLEWTYGWRPLASSIYNSVELFSKGAKTGFIRVKVNGTDMDRRSPSWNATGDSTIPAKTVETSSKRCMFDCRFGIDDSVLNNLGSLSSLNPVSIAWELVPYSVVFDWFIDIGSYLRNLESSLLYRSAFIAGFYTESYKVEGTTIVSGSYNASGLNRSWDLRGSYRYTGKRRSVLTSSPLPRPPSFKVDLGMNRLLSAASLLQQQLGRH